VPAALEIRVLGELELLRAGKPLTLPASKKTRALLGYLVVVGARPQPRQRLCELLWDGPDDPRAALRWSLTKIRPLVDDRSATRLIADREHVVFEAQGAVVDRNAIETVGPPANAALEVLRQAAALYRGELLEGLDLPDCYRYHQWCIAERERLRRLREGILAALVDRLADRPEEALAYARARVAIDPLAEPAHMAVMQLLGKLGRPREALRQYESCRQALDTQLGRAPSKSLEIARASIGQVRTVAPQDDPVRVAPSSQAPVPLVCRGIESAAIAAVFREVEVREWRQMLLIAGEPGIGKTRLLGEVADRALSLAGTVLAGRAFEAEMVRPFAPWIDVLRSVPPHAIDASVRADLAALLPELGPAQRELDRNRFFEAVATLVLHRSMNAPLVVALDDLQWFDEASVALLHYVARRVAGSHVLLVGAARTAEITGNRPVEGLLRAMAREGRLMRLDLGPLDSDGVTELVRTIHGHADPAKILSDGGGNPLFSIELARAAARGDTGGGTPTLDGLIAERLARLDERATELLTWAAALGHAFSVDALAAVTSLSVRDLLAALEQLERHGILRANATAPGGVGYDFAHDLVRRTAYRTMSEPRRRSVHLHVARTLDTLVDTEGSLAGDIAHHAALGGDSELAARAYVAAGERCLRLFALADASRLAASGMQHVARLAPETAVRLRLGLLSVHVHSNQWLKRSHELEAELRRVARLAEETGMHAEAARCYYLVSFVHNERGDLGRAGAVSLQAAEAGRAADVATRQQQLANTGRCLALIERDVERADDFLREAESLGQACGPRTRLEMIFGEGLVRAFNGCDAEAVALLEKAARLAAAESDHWIQSQALTRIARMALEQGRPNEALERCAALEPLVAKLSEGSERPLVAAFRALALLAMGQVEALDQAQRALILLRSIDSKAHLAYVLNALAADAVSAGRVDDGERYAKEALQAAEVVGHPSEVAVARSRLAGVALRRGDRRQALDLLESLSPELGRPYSISARARAAVLHAFAELRSQPDS
jgi:DNA-binding SARP family transcriptional activator